MERLKVLVSAYACEPNKGSEPGVGWNWVKQIAKVHEVWVLTRTANRKVIEGELAQRPASSIHFVYHDLPRWARFWKRGASGVHLYYYLWQLSSLSIARRLQAEVNFDLCHHITFASYRYVSALAWLEPPFVWGPLGGGERAPCAFYREFGLRGVASELVRDLSGLWAHVDPLLWYTRHRAELILATTQDTARLLGSRRSRPVHVLQTIGVEKSSGYGEAKPEGSIFRVLYVGNLLYLKGVTLALKAFAEFTRLFADTALTLVGDGPDRSRLERLAQSLGILHRVNFVGRLSRVKTLEQYTDHHVLLYPSLHDSGAMAVLEAMRVGLPVICLDLGGPALSVTQECGIKIAAVNPEQAVRGLAEALQRLASNPELRERMGREAVSRVDTHYDWDRKGEALNHLYTSVLARLRENVGLST